MNDTKVAFVGIDHVQVAVPEGAEQACRDFYVGLLGLDEIERPEATAGRSFLWVRAGGQQVHFRSDPEFRAARFAHPGFTVSDVDALERRVKEAGVEVTRADAVGPGRFHIRDPFGNRIEFVEAARVE